MTPRPTTEVSVVVLDSMDRMYGQLVDRLAGLTADEYLWEPVAGMWSVRPSAGEQPIVDGAGDREADPPPVTTIAWRLWHIAVDCFDDYTRRFDGDTADASAEWTIDPGEAIAILDEKWRAYRATIAARSWWDELGDNWGPWSRHSTADMAMHAGNELVHHAAEIALLRDLYGAAFSGGA
ncbi:MAG: DinB family protein [Ilumatobacter sp.]|nr:DinB family protein [Ilumatobacter sp.]